MTVLFRFRCDVCRVDYFSLVGSDLIVVFLGILPGSKGLGRTHNPINLLEYNRWLKVANLNSSCQNENTTCVLTNEWVIYWIYKSGGLTTGDPKIYRFKYYLTCPFWRLPGGRRSKRRSTANAAVIFRCFWYGLNQPAVNLVKNSPACTPLRIFLNPALKDSIYLVGVF